MRGINPTVVDPARLVASALDTTTSAATSQSPEPDARQGGGLE
jgi:hypothetical protein